MKRWLWAVLVLTACGDKAAEEADVSWHGDVQPMLEQHCTRCHTEGGQGVGNFRDLDEVRLLSGVMLERMESGEMPPPVADPTCRDYEGSEFLSLPDESVDVFSNWIGVEMPEGEAADAPESDEAEFLISLERANLEVKMPSAYKPNFNNPDEPGNEYRCFVLEHEQEDSFYITGMSPLVGEAALVHHIVLFRQPKADIVADYDPAAGYDCIDESSLFIGMLGGWAPGAIPVEFQPGYGFLVSPSDNLVMQIHYYSSGPESDSLTDQSGYEFRTVPSVEHPLELWPLGGFNFTIPAGDAAYTKSYKQEIPESYEYEGIEIPLPTIRLHGVFPHMHILGSGYRMWVEKPSGEEECAVASETYDFYNQLTYLFTEPMDILPGDTVHWSCTWNNSTSNPNLIYDPPQSVQYGERTDEEMCFMFSVLSTHW